MDLAAFDLLSACDFLSLAIAKADVVVGLGKVVKLDFIVLEVMLGLTFLLLGSGSESLFLEAKGSFKSFSLVLVEELLSRFESEELSQHDGLVMEL